MEPTETLTSIHTRQLADGPGVPVVFSHALGLDNTMWSHAIDRWRGQRPALAYDHRGHGASNAGDTPFGLRELVADAAGVIEAWGRGPVVFVGLSIGGMVAQGLALQQPAMLRGAVLAHTVARYDKTAQAAWQQRVATVRQFGMSAIVDLVVSRYLTDNLRQREPAVEQWLRQTILSTDAQHYALSCEAAAAVNSFDDLEHIACPVLIVAGAHDIGAPAEAMREIQRRIPGSKFVLLEHASHLSPLEQPDEFWSSVEEFVHTLEGASAHP